MSKVKRYDFVGSCRRGPTPDGYFVRFSDYAKLEAELLSERIQSDRVIECHKTQSAILASLQDREAKLVEALEKIAKAELWSHGHHIRLDATTIQEVTVFAAAALTAYKEAQR